MKKFYCDACGLCCRNISGIDFLKDFDNGFGVCKMLIGNLCSIYETRPVLCNVERAYKEHFSTSMSEEEFYKLNEIVCRKIKEVEIRR